jgi:hypothetical protein
LPRLRHHSLYLLDKFRSYVLVLYHGFKLLLKKQRHCLKAFLGHNNLTNWRRNGLRVTAQSWVEPLTIPLPRVRVAILSAKIVGKFQGGYSPVIGGAVSVIFCPSLSKEGAI